MRYCADAEGSHGSRLSLRSAGMTSGCGGTLASFPPLAYLLIMDTLEHPQSYYVASARPFPALPALQGEAQADVAIIGGGYTGLSAALNLAERGYQVVLIEQARIG